MRSCPQCNQTFGEQDFRVCPFDGAALIEALAPSADPMLGRILDGRFRIVDTIGQGGMGAVYKAVQLQMDRVCAIKVLSAGALDREAASARFRREARMTSRIDSPNAVTIYDFGEAEPGLLYLAMEYIEGESLAHLLEREGTLPLARVLSITNQIARALGAAHSLGIIHRDLKPANIMLTCKNGENEVVKVLDFGIAKSLSEGNADNLTQTGLLLGTPTYMSPEQVLGESVDSRSDVYSLAIIVYQMLSAQVPFRGDNLRTLMMKRLNTEPTSLRAMVPSIPEAVERVVMAGLSRDLESRIADVQTFAAALSAACSAPTPAGDHTITEQRDESGKSRTPLTQVQPVVATSSPERPTRPELYPETQVDALALPPVATAGSVAPLSPSVTLASPAELDSLTQERPPGLTPSAAAGAAQRGAVQWQQPAVSPTLIAAGGRRQSKLPYVVVAVLAVLAVAIVIAGAVGYYFYQQQKPAPPIASEQPTPVPPASADRVANEHYTTGRLQQQQAAELAGKGSVAAAAAKNEAAIAEYRKALETRPDFPEVHENLGVALYDVGRIEEAVVEYKTAIKQYPKPAAQVWTNYGMALLAVKQFAEAAGAFDQALLLQPTDADLYYYRGFARHFAGDIAGARESFSKYLEVSPQGVHADDVRAVLAGQAMPSLDRRSR